MSESTTTTKSICGSEDHENTEFSDDQKSDDSLSGTDDQSRELSILPQKPKEVPLRREIQLPDELLCHVFDFLTPVELLNIERVCSHWLNISRKLWSLRRTVVASNGVPLRQVASKLYHSKHLTKLVIKNYFPSSRLAESLILMAQSAPSIRSIELVDCELANEVLKAIGNGWPWLERIKLHYFTNNHERQREYPLEPDFDEGLHHLFTMCRSLSHVDLCLDRLPLPKIVALLDPVKIQAISLRSYFYRAEFFEDLFTALYAMVNLQSLSLHFIFDQHITSWWPEHAMINFLEKLAGLAPNISHLHLMFAEHFFRQTTPLWHFATACRHFSQLTHIDLNDNSGLETRDMQIIGLYCLQVKSLTLANAKLGTEQGLEYIAGCSKLQSLDISGTKYYDFDTRTYLPISSLSIKFLDRMTSIKHLKVNECIGLTPKSLYQALSTMAKLGSLETVEAKKVNACNHDFIAALYSALNPLQVSISQSGRWLRVDTDKHVLDNSPLLHNARGVSADPSCKGIVVWPSSKYTINVLFVV